MVTLILVAIAGFVAQLVDGSLGMAFGVTATTGLLAVGTAPAVASASVHLAEIGTATASGISHWRMGNVDWPVVRWLAVPGTIGGFLGATFLAWLSTDAAEPVMSTLLIALGLYVLLRFTLWTTPVRPRGITKSGRRWLLPLGLTAGFVDATGGGGWGPVSTTTLLSSGRLSPRRTVGSVDTSELPVSLGASVGFLYALGGEALSATVVGGLLIGGVLAAPLAAYLVRILPARVIGTGAGGLIVLTNLQAVLDAVGVPGPARLATSGVLAAGWVAAVVWAVRTSIAERRAAPDEDAEPADAHEPAGA
ncbi:sulfite exporter TauE/SafE family protein [Saccharopolyspora sp. HNM0983]|uniref:Probable membrane transporter protein n=2 Tax=Saccharopolyspora montiporae TaxID=2781240 RepID=A0A929BBW7_9PSEU|nr:sulfite exporter TauE/SafE family protein [Saccharopolyspora sp. HNM0983]MBE9376006.1 sulfite exporter TauE/SafE family protein [Saccharopolyspora sp. HNM0983]